MFFKSYSSQCTQLAGLTPNIEGKPWGRGGAGTRHTQEHTCSHYCPPPPQYYDDGISSSHLRYSNRIA